MRINRLGPLPTLVVAVVALIVGLATPAAAHQVNVIAHKISGSQLKPNSVTGKQVKESTLATVPSAKNATELGGKKASSYISTSTTKNSGLVRIPQGGAPHTLFVRYPLVWTGTCTVTGSGPSLSAAYTFSVTAAENVVLTRGPTEIGTQISAGHSLEIDNGGGNGTPVQGLTTYTVLGVDGAQYMGEFMGEFKTPGVPCAVAVSSVG